MSSGTEEVGDVVEAGAVAEEVTGAEEAGVVAAGAAEAGVAEAGATEALSVEAGGAIDALSVEAGAGVVDGLSMAMVTGVVAHTVSCGPIAGAVFPTVVTDTAAMEDTAATDTVRRS
jgi:hypothetical protein